MSRIKKRKEPQPEVNFPLIETGWEFLNIQLRIIKENDKDFFILDNTDFRERTQKIIKK